MPRYVPGVVVELTDGSIILGRQYLVRQSRAKITLSEGRVLETPADIVRTVQLQQPSGGSAAEWTRLVNMNVNSDLLVVRKDESLDYHQGVLHDVTGDVVRFEFDGEVLPVKRSKVYGFAYHHGAEAKRPPATCRITDVAGSQWMVRALSAAEKLQWTTPAGLSIAQAADQIVQIDFSGGKIVYLSDLKPEMARWTPYFSAGKPLAAVEQFYAPRDDRNFDGEPLHLAGTQYRKGLALHSRTEIIYRLSGPFSRFRAVAGIDDAVRPSGKARLVVRGDDKVLLDVAIAGTEAPRNVDLDLRGVRRLTIVVDFADNLSSGDYLLLCNARLSK